MINSRYIKYLFYSAIACTLTAIYIWFRQGTIDIVLCIFSYCIGIAFTSLITVKLPVFRQYFDADSQEKIKKYRGLANEKAALAMSGVVAGVVIGSCLYFFGISNPIAPSFVAAVSASVISQYHEK